MLVDYEHTMIIIVTIVYTCAVVLSSYSTKEHTNAHANYNYKKGRQRERKEGQCAGTLLWTKLK